ncbi:MAG TPA: hypothetical protein VG845_08065 [Dehalococcoidia bacterium]|nr:hypothetical protein [Dehalococcoidia bacterium]
MTLRTGLLVAVAMLLTGCSGSDGAGGTGARWSDSANETMLNALPAYAGATLVREWESFEGGEEMLVREYAVVIPAAQAADAVTGFYRDWLLKNGWTESPHRAAFSAFTKGPSRFVLGRVGPQLMEPPASARSVTRNDPPSGTGFFFTLEMTAETQGSAPR